LRIEDGGCGFQIIFSFSTTIEANQSALTIPVSSNIIQPVTFLAQCHQNISEENSQIRRSFQIMKVDGMRLHIQTQYGVTQQEAKSVDTHLNALI
jgi:hypothetical protein